MIDAGILQGRHVELLNGEIVEMPLEDPYHANSRGETTTYLIKLLDGRAKVRTASPITLANHSEPEPDVSVIQPLEYKERHPYPKDIFWVIEFSKTSLAIDLEDKTKIYTAAEI